MESFLRTVGRNAESTGASLAKAEDKARAARSTLAAHAKPSRAALTLLAPAQLRREIPETVAACQAVMDELLPQTLKAASPGDLGARVSAAIAAHDAQLPAKQAAVQALVARLYEQQERNIAHATATQQARGAATCTLAFDTLTRVCVCAAVQARQAAEWKAATQRDGHAV